MSILLTNATIVLRDAVITNGWLLIEADLIAGVGAMPHVPSIHGTTVRDLGGALLMPGVIDLHCDTIEKMVQPRPGVEIDGAVALHITDRLLVNSGVTCEFHSSKSVAPGAPMPSVILSISHWSNWCRLWIIARGKGNM